MFTKTFAQDIEEKKKYFVNLLLGVLITPLLSLGSENILSWMAGGNSEEKMHQIN